MLYAQFGAVQIPKAAFFYCLRHRAFAASQEPGVQPFKRFRTALLAESAGAARLQKFFTAVPHILWLK